MSELDIVRVYTVPLCFKINWREVFEEDLGIYEVYLDSMFTDGDDVRRKNHGHYRLEIVNIGPVEDSSFLEALPVPEWLEMGNSVSSNYELGPYSSLQPVPHIKSLTEDGLLTIAWDRKMIPY